jgi:hypothetical protein
MLVKVNFKGRGRKFEALNNDLAMSLRKWDIIGPSQRNPLFRGIRNQVGQDEVHGEPHGTQWVGYGDGNMEPCWAESVLLSQHMWWDEEVSTGLVLEPFGSFFSQSHTVLC